MIRIVYLCAVMAASAAAQNAAPDPAGLTPLAGLEQTVRQKTADWEGLSQNLDSSIRGLLPCDPKAAAAITAVSKASEARGAAISAYLLEAGKQAALQTAAARRALASLLPLSADLPAEKLDVAQEQSGVAGQLAAVTAIAAESGQHRPAFNPAQDALRQVAALEQQRSDVVDAQIARGDGAMGSVRELVTQLEAREQATKDVQSAFEAERVRWSAYYAARLARAQTECNVTKGGAAAPSPKGKQK